MRTTLLNRGQPDRKVVHLPNAVDVDRFAALPSPGSAANPGGSPRVIYCGTVGLAQGVGTLVDAAAELASDDQVPEVLIVGDGAERETLGRAAAERGLTHVRFLGRVPGDEVPPLIGSAAVAVLSLRDVPLFEDALPTKMLEYMAGGRPIVASAAGEVARVLARADAGIACRPGDPAALAEGIRQILADPARAARMGENAREYVEAHYSRTAFVATLDRIARELSAQAVNQ
jgi:glycosyltransferase involved in cell wall biosynthesis